MADVLDFSTDKSAMTRIRLIATFYKSSYAFVSWVISFICLALIYMQGIAIITPLFWFKLLTLGIIVLFINSYKGNEFYYYQNLGASKLLLWISTLLLDMALFIVLLILMQLVK